MWEDAFIAVSVVLGASYEEAREALGDPAGNGGRELLGALASKSRATRAQALATALAKVAVAVDGTALT